MEKEPRPAYVILDVKHESQSSKLHALDSVYSAESENGIEWLEYKGCGLAILDATEQVGFPIMLPKVSPSRIAGTEIWDLHVRGAKKTARDSRCIEATKCEAKLRGQEPMGGGGVAGSRARRKREKVGTRESRIGGSEVGDVRELRGRGDLTIIHSTGHRVTRALG